MSAPTSTAYDRRIGAWRTVCATIPGSPREFKLLVAMWIYRGGTLEGMPSRREVESLTAQLAEQWTGAA